MRTMAMRGMKMAAKAPTTGRRARRTRADARTPARFVAARVNADDLTDAARDKFDEVTTTLSEYWEDSDEKPALVTLGVYGIVGLVAANGTLRAVDGLPLIPDFLELVGILFSGFFVYQNLLYKPDRAALRETISKIYNKIL
ncbi:CAAD domains of cyanobacterial aminoacyl-tRNA synthetase-domain-containing protein [Ostreococcus tauri]|nr:CAAD domains of cyanobacterial aminoacyl-tRNA synthetase-domain-containing protein [Ostreococcus tauri]